MVVVEDRATGDSLASVLAKDGLEVMTATDSAEALALSDSRHPTAVIVDNQVSEGKGVDFARQLKEHDPSSAVLLLVNSASVDGALPAASDLDGFLVKPLLPQVFVQSVRRSLAMRALTEENSRLTSDVARLSGAEPVRPPSNEPPDRPGFVERLSTALTKSQVERIPLAVLVVELGGWQAVADGLGSAESEEAIAALAARLAGERRRTDIAARVATDRFALACSDVRSPADCHRVVRIVLDALEGPIKVDEKEHWLAPRAGAVITDPNSPGQSADSVLSDAETALVCARDERRPWKLFEKSMLDQVVAREEVGLGLREAMDKQELSLVYHPVTELQSARVVGAALRLRWVRPQDEVLLSSESVAQEGDLALSSQLGAWTLDRAFADLATWRDGHQLDEEFTLAISVSGREVADPQFAETIEELMAKHEIPPVMLAIDMSADAARQAAEAGFALERLLQSGVSFNLDDFGTADLKLAWMKDLPIKALKIDARLVEALDGEADARIAALVRALIGFAHEMKLVVVGKGVRTSAQRAALLAMGCELSQYSRFGRPGPPGHPWEPEGEESPHTPVLADADPPKEAGEIPNPDDVDPSGGT